LIGIKKNICGGLIFSIFAELSQITNLVEMLIIIEKLLWKKQKSQCQRAEAFKEK
jgi:hypothetical protein